VAGVVDTDGWATVHSRGLRQPKDWETEGCEHCQPESLDTWKKELQRSGMTERAATPKPSSPAATTCTC